MMRILLILLLLVLGPQGFAAESYLDVTAPTSGKMKLAIGPTTALSGAVPGDVARELPELFGFDLGIAGPFEIAPGEAAGALLLKSAYGVQGDTAILECRLVDQVLNKEIIAKRYSGRVKDLRRMGHAFSDEVLRVLTGEKGPFTGKIAYVSKASGNKEIYIMDYDGHNPQRLTNNGSINLYPDFAPSGKELIYTSYKKGNPDLYRRELFTGQEARLSSRSGLNAMGVFSQDGNKIALVLSKDGNSEIYQMSRDGKDLVRLTNNHAIDVSPAWSPDGSRIAFVSDRLGKPQLFVMDANGGNVRRLTTNGAYNVTPRWSPKGDRIVYSRKEGGFQIHAISPDGSGDAQLTSAGSNEHPRYSPDGRFIIFSSTRDGGEGLYLMRADGSGQTRISPDRAQNTHPTWSVNW
ncbi:protein TolB [Geomonas paludis]|uniref:Protein TolB n=2 Tax=Geomonas paludis TaxID=2740185 RepID=A0A6V8N0F6_9BACT|nr:Tol-Pal system beta propeller repeat protein TolB [Geomonas paludis]GFO65932.1 protein TolB [Geomonas paludis]